MTINSLKRINDKIYELNYKNWLGSYKIINVYPSCFRWRKLKDGSELSLNISTTLSIMSNELKIGDKINA